MADEPLAHIARSPLPYRYRGAGEEACAFETAPTERISREFGKRREQMDRELRAMAEIVNRHRQEFDDILSGVVTPIGDLRRQRARHS